MATAIATSPTWGGLSKEVKNLFILKDRQRWKETLKILSPDIILLSLGMNYIKEIDCELYNVLKCNEVACQEKGNNRRTKYFTGEIEIPLTNEETKKIKVINIVTANKAFQFRQNGIIYAACADILKKWAQEIKQARKVL